MFKFKNPTPLLSFYWIDGAVFIAGIFMTLGFSPFGLWPLSLLALAFLVWSFNQSNSSPHPKTRSFIRGGLFGLGFFGSGVSWIYVSLHTYGGANFILAGFITLLFIIYLSLYPALVGFSYQFLFKQPFLLKTLLVFPALWILSEFLRGYLFTGFPWLDIGYSGIHSPYVCMAPIWGVYGVGIVMLFCASLLAIAAELKSWLKLIPLVSLILLSIASYEGNFHIWTQKNQALNITLIQGNIAPTVKWDENQASHSLETYLRLTTPYLNNSDLIIWPEDSFPYYQDQASDVLDSLSQTALASHTAILLGLPIEYSQDHDYNGALLLGTGQGIYLKRHLVPFGEYTPSYLAKLNTWFGFPMSDFTPGPADQPLMQLDLDTKDNQKNNQKKIQKNIIKIGLMICYESIFPFEFHTHMQDANLLVSISDDSWFGKSLGPWQHEEIAEMRAKESGLYLLSATDSGITAVITPDGTIQEKIPPNTSGVLHAKVFAMSGQTPWMQVGIFPVITLILLGLVMAYCNRPMTTAPER